MSPDPYIDQLLDQELPCKSKPPLEGRINTVLHARAEKRGLQLCPFPSRAVLLNEIHELILTAEEARPNSVVNRIAYLGFFEVMGSGMLWVGDRLEVNGKPLGYLVGYDFAHLPNHMNIVVQVPEPLLTGFEMGITVGDPLRFVFVNGKREPF